MRLRYAMLAVLAAGLVACDQSTVDGRRIENPGAGEWLTYGRTYDEQRFSPLARINNDNASQLGVAWWAALDTDRAQEASPLISDGVIYITTAWSKVYAFDARSGKQLWFHDPKVPGATALWTCCDVVNRGAALWQGRVYVGTLDGRLIALDAKTGALAWSAQTTTPGQPYTITGAPRVVKGRVLIGNGGAEIGVRGYISAYDADTGKLAWRFYTAPNPEGKPDGAASDNVMAGKANATWSDGSWRQTGGGGTVWDAITYDPKTDLLYVGVGNGTPWNHKLRSGGTGDNLFLSSIVALKPDTGAYVWHYQTTPAESWDFTATQHIMVADLAIKGALRRVIMQAPKNGFFYVLDAKTGALLSADNFVPVTWAARVDLATGRPVENPGVRYENGTTARIEPGPWGGHNWQPMAFHPDTGLVYIPALQMPSSYTDAEDPSLRNGTWNIGVARVRVPTPADPNPQFPDGKPLTRLLAWDPVAGAERWTVDLGGRRGGGVLATAGGLVFHGAGTTLNAYNATTGERIWTYDAGAYIVAPPSTYELDGRQYVAVVAGRGPQGAQQGRLLVFSIGGTATPDAYKEVPIAPVLDLAAVEASPGSLDKGAITYANYCGICHESLRGTAPYLARSPIILSRADFKNVVIDGALVDGGMAPFNAWLNDTDVDDIRAYLLWRAGREK